jgi:hypothetical protein
MPARINALLKYTLDRQPYLSITVNIYVHLIKCMRAYDTHWHY